MWISSCFGLSRMKTAFSSCSASTFIRQGKHLLFARGAHRQISNSNSRSPSSLYVCLQVFKLNSILQFLHFSQKTILPLAAGAGVFVDQTIYDDPLERVTNCSWKRLARTMLWLFFPSGNVPLEEKKKKESAEMSDTIFSRTSRDINNLNIFFIFNIRYLALHWCFSKYTFALVFLVRKQYCLSAPAVFIIESWL